MGAVFDPTGRYRYSLWRVWNPAGSRIAFIMLNPSTADATANDPTIRRCIGFAQQWGYGSLEVVNLFAYRAAQPRLLKQAKDPVGAENDRYLLAARNRAKRILVGWGNGGKMGDRSQQVLQLLGSLHPIYCLGINLSGQPRHPLYVPKTCLPLPFITQK